MRVPHLIPSATKIAAVAAIIALSGQCVLGAYVFVGDAGNANDTDPGFEFGAVASNFNIGEYEVTNTQYAAFLTDQYHNENSLFNASMTITESAGTYTANAGTGQNPVNFVSLYDATRYVNWLNMNRILSPPGASLSDAAYTMPAGEAGAITENAGFAYYLPSRDQWYKAAFYNSGTTSYYMYAAGSDTLPTAATLSGYTVTNAGANTSNYGVASTSVAAVGSAGSMSPYGAYDMSGNVSEWTFTLNEALAYSTPGGNFNSLFVGQATTITDGWNSGTEREDVGFRVLYVPEPGAFALALIAGMAAAIRRRRRA